MKVAEPDPADLAEIDSFCDTLWLEDGLARASLASYRSDLLQLAQGKADLRDLFQHGQVRVDGDVALAKQLSVLNGLV